MKNNRIGVVLLSRMSSSRLPGKALLDIDGRPVLQFIYDRLRTVLSADQILVATSDQGSDDPIEDYCKRHHIHCFRGSLDHVAYRFLAAAETMNWEYAVRINGDNVFVDTQLLKKMLELAGSGSFDFISNVKNRTYPKGMSIEIVRTAFFRSKLPQIDGDERYREHVTLYFYENEESGRFHFEMNTTLPLLAGIQLALDTEEDLIRTRFIAGQFADREDIYNSEDILAILKSNEYGEPV